MADTAGTSRLGTCQTCAAQPARYKCPACSFPSCSLACSTAHKQATPCSGVAPPVWSRPIQANEMTWGSLMRDQSYIAGVNRAVEDVGRQLVADKVLPQGRGSARPGDDTESVRLDERNDREERIVREAQRDGVELVLLPKGMSKRLKNGTHWNHKQNRLEWTVEVAFQPRPSSDPSSTPPPPVVITTVPQPATSSLYAVLTSALGSRDKKGKGKAREPEDDAWILAEKAWVQSFKPSSAAATSARVEKDEAAMVGAEEHEGADREGVTAESAALETAEAAPAHAAAAAPADDVAPHSSSAAPSEDPASTSAPDDSPFVLLLAFYVRPAPSYDDGYANAPSTSSSSSPSTKPSRPPARQVYLVTPTASPTLRQALAGATLLETPLFEVWPRETFLRQQLLGRIKVVAQPSAAEVAARRGEAGSDRGRGRGSGRGRGGGLSGRGAYHGHGGGGTGGGDEQQWGGPQDSGWGSKRGGAAVEGGDEKRARVDAGSAPGGLPARPEGV